MYSSPCRSQSLPLRILQPGSRSPAAALRRQAVNGRGGGNGSGGDAGMGDMRASPESLRAPHAASSMKRTAVNDLGRVQSAGTLRNVSPASADVPTPVGQSSVRGFDLAPRPVPVPPTAHNPQLAHTSSPGRSPYSAFIVLGLNPQPSSPELYSAFFVLNLILLSLNSTYTLYPKA